jgi:hypothetical protein
MRSPADSPLDPPPRKAHLRRATRNLRRAYRMLLALVILVFAGWAVLDAVRWYDLAQNTRIAPGVITRKHVAAKPAGNEHRLDYTFTTNDGVEFQSSAVVSQPVHDGVAEGQHVPIVYLPRQPAVDHWLVDNEAIRSHVMYLTIGHGLAALLAIVVLRLVELPLAREMRLARLGYVAPGRITSISKSRGRRGVVSIVYAFRTVAGADIEGRCTLPRKFPVETLAVGDTVEVLYDPSRPRVNKPRRWLGHVEFGDPPKKGKT